MIHIIKLISLNVLECDSRLFIIYIFHRICCLKKIVHLASSWPGENMGSLQFIDLFLVLVTGKCGVLQAAYHRSPYCKMVTVIWALCHELCSSSIYCQQFRDCKQHCGSLQATPMTRDN